MPGSLATEIRTYRLLLSKFLKNEREGQYVVIKGDDVHGFYPELEIALDAAYKAFGHQPFLCRQIMAEARAGNLPIAC